MSGYFLLIDVGNTRVKWARIEGEQLISGVPSPALPDSLSVMESTWSLFEPPLGVALSNVAGERVEGEITSFIHNQWSLVPFIAKSQNFGLGVTSGYQEPERLGVDRWLALVAARARSLQPVVIVDAGSACTIDLLDAKGCHLGGYILPGLVSMGNALAHGTHQIQRIKNLEPVGLDPGTDTVAGISSGALLALVGAIERVIKDFDARGFKNPLLLMTGGDAESLAGLLRYPAQVAADLVLEGLWARYRESLSANR